MPRCGHALGLISESVEASGVGVGFEINYVVSRYILYTYM